MMRFYVLSVIFAASCLTASGQVGNCTQVLRVARSTYETGRLHELPGLVEGCLTGADPTKSFTKEEKRETYRLLTLAYIYLEEPEKADEMMLKLLETDPFFEINQSLDPAEFTALYNKFRHDPLFRIGLKFGVNATQPTAISYYSVGSAGAGDGSYSLSPSIQFLAVFEKDITKKIVLAPELGYVSRGFEYNNAHLNVADENSATAVSSQNFIIKQSYIDLNIIGQYKFKNTIKTQTFVGIGPSISYLLSSTNQATTILGNGFTVTGTTVDDSKSYNKLLYSATIVAGAKLKFGDLYLIGDVRAQLGLVNVINKSARTNPELAYDYQGQYNDYRMNNYMVSVGIIYPYFKPKKLIK